MTIDREFMSFGGTEAAQILADYYLWEALLNSNQQIKAIVELGTWKGGFSLFLHAQAEARDLRFRTYDIIKPDRRIPGFVQIDIFGRADAIGEHLKRQGEVALLCDGGNKPRELRTFPRYCHDDSLFIVHDWGTEMLSSDVPDDLEETMGPFCDRIGSMSRVFRKRL